MLKFMNVSIHFCVYLTIIPTRIITKPGVVKVKPKGWFNYSL